MKKEKLDVIKNIGSFYGSLFGLGLVMSILPVWVNISIFAVITGLITIMNIIMKMEGDSFVELAILGMVVFLATALVGSLLRYEFLAALVHVVIFFVGFVFSLGYLKTSFINKPYEFDFQKYLKQIFRVWRNLKLIIAYRKQVKHSKLAEDIKCLMKLPLTESRKNLYRKEIARMTKLGFWDGQLTKKGLAFLKAFHGDHFYEKVIGDAVNSNIIRKINMINRLLDEQWVPQDSRKYVELSSTKRPKDEFVKELLVLYFKYLNAKFVQGKELPLPYFNDRVIIEAGGFVDPSEGLPDDEQLAWYALSGMLQLNLTHPKYLEIQQAFKVNKGHIKYIILGGD